MKDLVVVGAGPAGYAAALYAKRYGMDVVVVGSRLGGLCNEAHVVQNWPGTKSIEGCKLVGNMREQVEDIGVEVIQEDVVGIGRSEEGFTVNMREDSIPTKTVILAIGTEKRKLEMENEDEFIGRGVSYCTTCDAPLYKDEVVGVVGGRDSAAKSALLLREHAKKVYIIYRRDDLRAEEALKEDCEDCGKIEMVYNATPEKVVGDDTLEKVILDDGRELELSGLFIEIGSVPNKALMDIGDEKIKRDKGYIEVGEDQSTNVDGVFAAGDVTTGSNRFRQIVTAAAEGAIAALSAYKYTKKKR